MIRRLRLVTGMFGAIVLIAGAALADGNAGSGNSNHCMEVNIEPFHMMPGYMAPSGACAVRDYWDGELQETFYPFTIEEHLFNCEYFGDLAPLPTGDLVPSSVVSQGEITGTIGGHAFSATLYCASLTNWYQNSCADPTDPLTCSFQLAQPFLTLTDRTPYPRVTEVSVFDGVVTVENRRNKTVEIPVVMATRAAGITHLEDLSNPEAPQVGASVTHSLLGLLTHEDDGDDVKVLDGSLDVLLQGHIFFPETVENDPGAAVIKGTLCSQNLYKLLNETAKKGKKRRHRHHDH